MVWCHVKIVPYLSLFGGYHFPPYLCEITTYYSNSFLLICIMCPFCRDPNSTETLQVFQEAIEWACSGGFSEKDVDEAKLSVFSQVSVT